MTEEPGSRAAEHELREAYLYVNDPFHSGIRILTVTTWVALLAAMGTGEEVDVRAPLVAWIFLGAASAWSRWYGQRIGETAIRKSLARTQVFLRWALPVYWLILAGVLLAYAYLLRQRWEFWTSAPMGEGAEGDVAGRRGSLVFPEDRVLFYFTGVFAFLFGWMYLVLRPRLRAALART